jgi:DNA-directed RNA polymerase sigma subunit (sigma70/sigma32)
MDGADDSGTLAERLTDPHALLPDGSVMRGIERERLRAAFGALSPDVQHVLVLHWGLDDEVPRSVHQISRLLNRHVEEISAIVTKSRRLLGERLGRAQPAPPFCIDIGGAGHRATFQYLPRRTPRTAGSRRFGLTGIR